MLPQGWREVICHCSKALRPLVAGGSIPKECPWALGGVLLVTLAKVCMVLGGFDIVELRSGALLSVHDS